MRKRLLSTRGRLALIAGAVLLLAAVLADAGLVAAVAYLSQQETEHAIEQQAQRVDARVSTLDGSAQLLNSGLPDQNGNGVAVDIAVVGSDAVLAQTADQPFRRQTLVELAAPSLRRQTPYWAQIRDAAGVERTVFVLPSQQGRTSVAIVASRPLAGTVADVWRSIAVLGVLSVLIVTVGSGMAYWLAGRVLRPVARIAQLAESLSEKDLHRRVDIRAPEDELGELVETFNRMLERLESSFSALRTFTADASHELRAPLTLMRSEIELALAHSRNGAAGHPTLQLLLDEVDGMASTIERLLLLARADAGSLNAAIEVVDMVDLIEEEVQRWRARAAERRLRLVASCPDECSATVDPVLLRRIVDNLLENAIRHAPAGSDVEVALLSSGAGLVVEVSDHGAGVPTGLEARLFTRFFRADSSRRRGTEHGGAGLGLAVSKAMAIAMDGDLEYARRPTGSTFSLLLPRPGRAERPGDAGAQERRVVFPIATGNG